MKVSGRARPKEHEMTAVRRITDEYFRNTGSTSFNRERLVLEALSDSRGLMVAQEPPYASYVVVLQYGDDRPREVRQQATAEDHVAAIDAARAELRAAGWVLDSSHTYGM
jgi:hypothetical protein